MSNKRRVKRDNNPANIYSLGSWLSGNPVDGKYTEGLFKGVDVSTGNIVGSLGGIAGNIGGNLIGGDLESGAGNAISSVGSTIGGALSTVNPLLGGVVSAASGVLGGFTDRAFGSKLNQETINDIEAQNKKMANAMVASGSNNDILNQWGSQDFGDNFNRKDIGKDGWFSNKAKNTYNRLKKEQQYARNRLLSSYDNAIENTAQQSLFNTMANYSALGGPLDSSLSRMYNNALYIPPVRGQFNTFSSGGKLTHGGVFDNGVTIIGNGDSHENNPYEGVQMGVDPQGVPNLVEENEVVWNNYVFSDRLKANKEIRSKYKMRGSKEMSFADMAKKLSKESEERPNDPISKRGLIDSMMKLQQAQEIVRQKKQASQEGKKYAYGGKKGKLYSGTGPYTNFLDDVDGEGNVVGYTKNGILMDDGSIATYGSPEYEIASEYGLPEEATTKGIAKVVNDTDSNLSWLRYAPVVGNTMGVLQNILSKPDYSRANRIERLATDLGTAPRVGYTPLGDYMKYNPMDINHLTNKLSAESAAVRRTLLNSSSPSRTAGILAADYNAQNILGDTYKKAVEYNLAQRQAADNFNRGTNQANAEMGLKASVANAELAQKAKQLGLSATISAIQAKENIDAARNAALNANINQLFTGLGNIGKEQQIMKLLSNGKYRYDKNGNLIYIGG